MNPDKELKILMLEDSDDDVYLIEHVLRKNKLLFSREVVDTREEFTDSIERFKPDIVLSDHGLPGFNSKEALKICLNEKYATPFILVTGTVSDEYAINCLKDGADDYILKTNLSRLPAAIRGTLEKRKAEKLKQEASSALREQNIELLKVNKELDNFIYSVSHNLRGPLASVMGLLNLSKNEGNPGALEGLHAMMSNSIFKLDETLKEIMDFAKNARTEVQHEEINWTGIVESTFEKLDYLDPFHRLNKQISIKAEVPFFSDNDRLRIIFTNLISNAMVYSKKEGVMNIELSIATSAAGATIIIRDYGLGIREHILPKVFDMFYRGTEESTGAGLGLYIVKEMLTKLNGKIVLESIDNEGTCVTITIPIPD